MYTQKYAVVQTNLVGRRDVDYVWFYAHAIEYSQCGIVGPFVRKPLLAFCDQTRFIPARSATETS